MFLLYILSISLIIIILVLNTNNTSTIKTIIYMQELVSNNLDTSDNKIAIAYKII